MTRATERPPMSDLDQQESWEHTEGDSPDGATRQALSLAHQAAGKFPDLVTRYSNFAGKAAIVSGALIALAGVAVARRLRRGQQPEEILDQITEEEIIRAATATSRHNRIWRMVQRIANQRYAADEAPADEESAEEAPDEGS